MDEFRDLYIQTARERLQQLNDLLLKLESNPDQLDLVEELMRTGHSLKGESAAMGFEQIATLAHVIEDLFSGIGNGQLEINKPIMDALFASLDYIEQSIDQIESDPKAMDLDSTEYVKKLKDLTGLKTEGFGKSQRTADGKVKVEIDKPATAKDQQQSTADEKKASPASSSPSKSTPPAAKPKAKKISTVTMKVEKLDTMMNISEELVLLKMKLKNSPLLEENSQLKADIHRLDRLVTDMQFNIMQARLFPISLAMHTLPRLVRDVSQKTGKQVKLELEGEDTTVDRTIIDHLTEPFVHMIRNAVDHGIESPEERQKLGKPLPATIKVKAYTKQNKVYIEISDDGQGIDYDALVQASIKKGVVDAATVAKWDDEQKKTLLFADGVSTSEQVTDVSGRGVGMSAVERAIKKLGGDILVDSTPGQGTTFTLRLPLTLAIMQALLVRIAGHYYAFPANEISRSIQVPSDRIQSSGNRPVIVVNQQEVPLIDLKQKFATQTNTRTNPPVSENPATDQPEANQQPTSPDQAKADSSQTDQSQLSNQTVVLVRHNNDLLGCVVDKIVAEEEILVKPLNSLLKKQTTYFAGATILADGRAALIINVDGLLNQTNHH